MLITDHTATHNLPGYTPEKEHGLKVFNLSHIKVVLLHPSAALMAQPLHQGIIAAFKARFRNFLVQWLSEVANQPGSQEKQLKDLAPNAYQAMLWLVKAWTDEAATQTIKNCWRKSALLPESTLQPDPVAAAAGEQLPEERSSKELADAIHQLQQVAVKQELLPKGHKLMSAEEFLDLAGESDIVEDLSDSEIVALIQSQGVDHPDSEDDEEKRPEACTITLKEALAFAERLEKFAFNHPEYFCADQTIALGKIRCQLNAEEERRISLRTDSEFKNQSGK